TFQIAGGSQSAAEETRSSLNSPLTTHNLRHHPALLAHIRCSYDSPAQSGLFSLEGKTTCMGNAVFCALLLLFFGLSVAAQPTKPMQTATNSKASIDTSAKTEMPASSQSLFPSKYDFVPGEKICSAGRF